MHAPAFGLTVILAVTLVLVCGLEPQSVYGGEGSGPAFEEPLASAVEADGSWVVVDIARAAVLRVHPVTGDRTIVSDATTGSGPVFGGPDHIAINVLFERKVSSAP